MAGEVEQMGVKVQEAVGTMASAAVLIQGFAQFVRDHATDPAALIQYANDLDAAEDALLAAVAANPLPQ